MASATFDSQATRLENSWQTCFPSDQRQAMLNEDLFAGKSVSAVLVSIVALGLLLMTVTVLLVI